MILILRSQRHVAVLERNNNEINYILGFIFGLIICRLLDDIDFGIDFLDGKGSTLTDG